MCGDLFTHLGNGAALTSDDIAEPAIQAEGIFRYASLAPETTTVMRRLGDLALATLALRHGSSFNGDCAKALYDVAGAYETQVLA